MAKSKAETRTIWRLLSAFREEFRTFCQDRRVDLDAIITEIKVGGPETYMEIMIEEANRMKDILNSMDVAARRFYGTVHMPLGAYAGSSAPTQSAAVNMSMFNKKLVDDGESVESLGLTKTPFAPGVGNAGDADVIELNDDPNGTELQGAHNETLKLECISIAAAGRPAYSLQGGERTFDHYDDNMGTGNAGNGYLFSWGGAAGDFSRAQRVIVTSDGPVIVGYSGTDARNMVNNGGLEQELSSGNGKVPGATFLSGEANVTEEVTTPIVGDRSLEASGDFVLEFPCVGDIIGRAEFMTMLVRRRGTKTGNISLIYRSDVAGVATDHESVTVALGSLSADAIVRISKAFVVPANLGDNPRVAVVFASSGSTGSFEFDELVKGAMSLFDSNRAIAAVEGAVPTRIGDRFDGSNAIVNAADQAFQRNTIEVFSRSLEHAGAPTYWTTS